MTQEEAASEFMDKVLHLFEVGARVQRRPLQRPAVVFAPEDNHENGALYHYASNTIEVFPNSVPLLQETLVHELVHAWWWQEKQLFYHGASAWHGPRFQDKLAVVYFRLGWGKPGENTRSCKTEPAESTTEYPVIMDLWST